MKALILNFSSFDKKDKSASYYRFDMWDIEGKQLIPIFTEQQYLEIPDGEIPDNRTSRDTFPRVADVDFKIVQYRTQDGKTGWSPRVDAIRSWKTVDLKRIL